MGGRYNKIKWNRKHEQRRLAFVATAANAISEESLWAPFQQLDELISSCAMQSTCSGIDSGDTAMRIQSTPSTIACRAFFREQHWHHRPCSMPRILQTDRIGFNWHTKLIIPAKPKRKYIYFIAALVSILRFMHLKWICCAQNMRKSVFRAGKIDAWSENFNRFSWERRRFTSQANLNCKAQRLAFFFSSFFWSRYYRDYLLCLTSVFLSRFLARHRLTKMKALLSRQCHHRLFSSKNQIESSSSSDDEEGRKGSSSESSSGENKGKYQNPKTYSLECKSPDEEFS